MHTEKLLSEFRQTFDLNPDIIIRWGKFPERKIDSVSDNISSLFGYNYEDFKLFPEGYFQIIYPEDKEKIKKNDQAVISGSGLNSFTLSYRIITQDGTIKWVNEYTLIRRDQYGKISYLESLINEKSENLYYVDRLNESEKKYRIVADYTYDWEYWINENLDFVYNSPSCELITGYKPEDFQLNKDLIYEIIHPDDRLKFKEHLYMGTSIPGHIELNIRIRRADGQERWIEHFCQPVFNALGRFIGQRGSNRDFTYRKVAEDSMRESEAKLRVIFDNSSVGMVLGNPEGKLITYNNSFAQIVGHDKDELYNVHFSVFTHPDDIEAEYTFLQEIKDRKIDSYTIEKRYINKQCQVIWVRLNVSVIWLDNEIKYFVGIIENINELKKAEISLHESREKYINLARQLESIVQLRTKELENEIENHKSTVKELQKSEARFRTLFEQAGVGVAQINSISGRFIKINQKYSKIIGYSNDEMISMTYQDVSHPEDIAKDLENMEKLRDGDIREFSMEKRLFNKSGAIVWVNLTVSPMWETGEEPTYHVAVIEDITENKLSRETLQDAYSSLENRVNERTHELSEAYETIRKVNAYNRSLIEASLDPLVTIGPDGRITDVNSATEAVTGFSREELIGTDFSTYFTEPVKASDGYMHVFNEGRVFDYPLDIRHRNGHITSVLYNASVFRDEQGNIIGVFAAARDITQRKNAEDELQRYREQLEQLVINRTKEINKLSQAVENSPAVVVITNSKGLIEYVNPKFTEHTGYTANEALNKNPRILKSGIHTNEFYTELWSTLKTGNQWSGEICNKKKNGELFWEYASIAPIRDQSGVITHYVAVKEDITRRKEMEKELMNAKEAAEQASRAKSEFLSNMSHELRTPLNAVIGFSQILQRQRNINESQKKQLETIYNSGIHLLSLINDILDMSKIEAQKLILEIEEFNLQSMLQFVYNSNKHKAEEKFLDFSMDLSSKMPNIVLGDQRRLKQIMLNLTSNAVKYTIAGEVKIVTSYDSDNSVFTFEINDTGPGIAQENLEKIFEPFVQVSNLKHLPGTGLGLSITQKLVSLMKGSLKVTSVVGKGSMFRAEIPLKQVESYSPKFTSESPVPDFNYQNQVTGLIVDDDESNVLLLASLLKEIGLKYAVATDGMEAIVKSKEIQPDIIFMDLMMPGMNGIEAIAELRKIISLKEIKIFGITAAISNKQQMIEFKNVCDDFLPKPIDVTELYNKIGSLLKIEEKVQSGKSNLIFDKKHNFNIPPENILNQLKESAEIGEFDNILELINSFKNNYPEFSSSLIRFLERYDSDGIVMFINQCIKK